MAAKSRFVTAKLVKITTVGPILPLGGIYGPTIPQVLSTKIISSLLIKGYKVKEILKNKSEVDLNLMNYNVDLNGDGGNYLHKYIRPSEPIQTIPKKNETPKEEFKQEQKQEEKIVNNTPDKKEENKNIINEKKKEDTFNNNKNETNNGLMSSKKKDKPKADELESK